MRKDQKQFVAKFINERNIDLTYYKRFDYVNDRNNYELIHDTKIENYQNIMYNEEDEMTQIKIIKVTQRKKRI